MKKILIVLAALAMLTGCTTNGVYDPGKTWTLVGVVVVGGAVAASQDSGGGSNCQPGMGVNGNGTSIRTCN